MTNSIVLIIQRDLVHIGGLASRDLVVDQFVAPEKRYLFPPTDCGVEIVIVHVGGSLFVRCSTSQDGNLVLDSR